MLLNKYLVLGMFGFVFYSCQSPQAKDQINEKEKITYHEKSIEAQVQGVKKGSFSKEILSNGILSPVKKSKLVFKVNESISKVL